MIYSVQKAMRILSVISDQKGEPLSLGRIAERTALPKPTCSHLLATLEQDGYVKRISHTLGYVLGPSTYYLSRYGRYENERIVLARPVMRWMERQTHATVVLSVIENHRKYIVEYMDNEQNLFRERSLIKEDDIYRTATGRAILAQMNRDEIKEVWKSNGPPPEGDWDEVKSYEELLDALSEVKRQSVVITKGSKRKDSETRGFACPLFQRSACIGAVGLAWTRSDESEEELARIEKKLCDVLLKGKKEIQRRLLYAVKENTVL